LSPLQERLAARLTSRRPASAEPPDGWWAGVAVLLAPAPDSVLLIRRANRVGDPWSGHIGLPGGRLAPDDPDLLATAIRETREEVGVDLAGAHLLGMLDDVAPRTPLPRVVVVRPFVFALPERPALHLSAEVAQALWVELADLARAGVYQETEIEVRGERRRFPAYRLGEHLVWGLTERILSPLLALAGIG
jgi:8-oxo-dGTP pyrophosphatase MutT (NUDIX family)